MDSNLLFPFPRKLTFIILTAINTFPSSHNFYSAWLLALEKHLQNKLQLWGENVNL